MTNYETLLKKLRREIDRADQELVKVLGRRMKVVQQIGQLKKKHDKPVLQSARFEEILKDRVRSAKKRGLEEAFARNFLKLLHREALRIQKKMRS